MRSYRKILCASSKVEISMCILLHTREIYQWAGDQDLLVYKWGYSSLLDLCYIIDDLYKNFTKSVNFCLLLLKERWTASTRSGSAFASVSKNWIDDFDDSYIFFFQRRQGHEDRPDLRLQEVHQDVEAQGKLIDILGSMLSFVLQYICFVSRIFSFWCVPHVRYHKPIRSLLLIIYIMNYKY